jgi:ubiquinone/menaquinone biosynthesis C-methylase UbiE
MKSLLAYRAQLEAQGVSWEVLVKACQRPSLDTPSTKPFWADPHIASQMMRFHLDPQVEAASKSHAVIDAECAYLAKAMDLKPGMTLVDLGCGPGLYLERWVATGAQLVGVDLSPLAIETAQKRLNAPIEWLVADYRNLPKDLRADVMTLIYYDFTALPVADQLPLLSDVVDRLNQGGLLVLDVMTPANPFHESLKVTMREGGFWSPLPHTEIHQVFCYETPHVILDQYTLIDNTGHLESIRVQNRLMKKPELAEMLKAAGMTPITWLSDLSGTPFEASSKTLAVIAQKNHSLR